jgi:hypothetical protein
MRKHPLGFPFCERKALVVASDRRAKERQPSNA